jgi:hypothetical protein
MLVWNRFLEWVDVLRSDAHVAGVGNQIKR